MLPFDSMTGGIFKNSAAVFASRIMNGAAGLTITLVLVRSVDVPSFGRFAFALALGTLAAVLAELGIGLAMVREISRNREAAGRIFGTLLTLRLIASLGVGAASIGLAFALVPPQTFLPVVLGVGVGLTRALSRHLTSLFYGFERMEIETGLLFVEALLTTTVVVAGALLEVELTLFMLGLLFAYGIGLAMRLLASLRLLRGGGLAFWDPEVLSLVRDQASAYGLFAIAGMTYAQADVPLVTLVLGEEMTGFYQAGARILVFLMLLPDGLSNALLPAATRSQKSLEGQAISRKVSTYLAALSLPISVGGILLSVPLIALLYGTPYARSAPLFALLLLALPLRFHSMIQGTLLTANGKQVLRARVMLLVAVTLLPAMALGAHLGGLLGIAVARIGIELLLLLGYTLGLGLALARSTAPMRLPRIAACVAVMAAILIAGPGMHVGFRVALGAIVYGLMVLALGVVPREDLQQIWKRK